MEGPFVNGVEHGRWIWRGADGDSDAEVLFEEGEERETSVLIANFVPVTHDQPAHGG